MNREDQKEFDLMEFLDTEREKFKKEKGYTEEILSPDQHREFIDFLKRKVR